MIEFSYKGDRSYVKIADIKITRERFREPENIPALANSLQTFGQLQPIILDAEGELSAGCRRYTAAKSLGWEEIWAVSIAQMTENVLLARSIELEENVQREDMSWAERVKAIAELDRLKRELDPNWSQMMTAQVAGTERQRVTEAVNLNKLMEIFPELKDAKSFHQAKSWALAKVAGVSRVKEVKDNPADFGPMEERVKLGDSVEVIKQLPSGVFHFILTDPPFGINYDNRKAGTEQAVTAYKDDEESYERILGMAPDLYRVLRERGWLVWFLGPTWYERAKLAFRAVGFTVDEMPIIWDRSDGRCYTSRPDRYFARGYDMALHCIKGDPQIIQRNKPNVLRIAPVPSDDRDALVERPVELYQELIRRLTVEGEIVADFFTGTGSVLAAAASLKRDYFGVELDPARRAIAMKKILAYTASK